MKYKPSIVLAYFKECGIPTPELEYKFHPKRKWRFDFSWIVNSPDDYKVDCMIALECDGGIFVSGGHNRGAQMLKTWEKENEAVCLGWRILRCQPKDLCTQQTVNLIKRALGI